MNGVLIDMDKNDIDWEELYNIREWVADAIVTKGAHIHGCGFGMGQADLDFKLDGFLFSLSVKPMLTGE